jgi:hypothetical protein
MRITEFTTESVKQRLDPKCWKGKHKEGTKIKGGVRVNNCVPNESVTEGHSDQQRKVFKKNGEPVGEVGIDRESSPGVGQWYMKHYASGNDLAGYDSYEEAVEELKHCMKQGVAEGEGGLGQVAGIGINGKQFNFSIKDLIAKAQNYPIKKLNPQLFVKQLADRHEDPKQTAARAQAADLQYPIIVVQDGNTLMIADGTHRAQKAIMNKLPSINAYVIPVEDMAEFSKQGVAEGNDDNKIYDRGYRDGFAGKPKNDKGYDGNAWASYRAGYLDGKQAAKSKQGVAEGHADQQRKVFKKNGHPVGEVGIDRESSPGVGQYYMKHYASGKDLAGYDSFEEAVAELKHCMKQGVAENKELAEEFDLIESIIEDLADRNGVDSEVIWEDLESLDDDELYVFAVTQPIMEDLDEMDRRGFLKAMGAGVAVAGASSLGANTAFAQSMPNINTQKLNLANKYYAALVQRAKEDGLPLDTRTTNMLKAKAEEMATRQLRQTQPQASSYPGAQSSEIQRSNNYNQFESEAWQKANKKDKTDGMSKKAVKTYRREHPGSKLQTAVTTKPSKLKKGSKASKRRKSYCSRSKGQMKMHNISCAKTPDKAICKARRRWNC